VIDVVLNPGKIGVAFWRDSEFPAGVFGQKFAFPVRIVKRRILEDEIGFQVFVQVVVEGISPFYTVVVYAADGEVHFAEAPGGLV
jgi:hypothetical protein